MNSFWLIFGAWCAAAGTLAIFSFLYKDNPFFKAAEHLFLGVSISYSIILLTYGAIVPKIIEPIGEMNFWPLLPAFLGALVLTRFIPKQSWMSRISFAFVMGYAAGLTIPTAVVTRFLKQVAETVDIMTILNRAAQHAGVPVDALPATTVVGIALTFLVGVVGLFSVLTYFFFSVEHKGPIQKVSVVGIYFIMVYLGGAFGTTVMGRFSLLYGRLFDLYTFRTGQYYYATPILLILFVFALAVYFLKKKPEKGEG